MCARKLQRRRNVLRGSALHDDHWTLVDQAVVDLSGVVESGIARFQHVPLKSGTQLLNCLIGRDVCAHDSSVHARMLRELSLPWAFTRERGLRSYYIASIMHTVFVERCGHAPSH